METITLYTRPGCHLCDEMKDELVRLGYDVDEVDIGQDPALEMRYGWRVPVALRTDGSLLAEGHLHDRIRAASHSS